MPFKTHLILGGPGAGKTQRLMSVVSEYLKNGIPSDRIAFVSFTRKAVREAAERASAEFNLPKEDLIHFRTLHSMAYSACGVRRDEVFGAPGTTHRKDLAEATCCKFTTVGEVTPFGGSVGDRGLFLDNYARSTCTGLHDVWRKLGEGVRWPWLQWFAQTLKVYKEEQFLLDYTDMLSRFLELNHTVDVDVAIIDEAQDLSHLQWKVARSAFRGAKNIYVAGDDDQAIYKWSGADVERFLELKADTVEILPKSHRLSPKVFEYSQNLIKRVRRRYEKDFSPVPGRAGSVKFHRYISSIPLVNDGSWLLLARNKTHLRNFETFAKDQGVLFSTKKGPSVDPDDVAVILDFENARKGNPITGEKANAILKRTGKRGSFKKDAEVTFADLKLRDELWHKVLEGIPFSTRNYYLALLRKGVNIRKPPIIHLDTIHSVKGGEADHVAIISDMTARTYRNLQFDPDDEYRVWYVGITRTKGDLHVVLPDTLRSYPV